MKRDGSDVRVASAVRMGRKGFIHPIRVPGRTANHDESEDEPTHARLIKVVTTGAVRNIVGSHRRIGPSLHAPDGRSSSRTLTWMKTGNGDGRCHPADRPGAGAEAASSHIHAAADNRSSPAHRSAPGLGQGRQPYCFQRLRGRHAPGIHRGHSAASGAGVVGTPMNAPHIVLITVDHLRADFMGCAGHPVIRTPHIDFLARRGVRFTNAYSTCPVCIPARATLMTGLEGDSLHCTELLWRGSRFPCRQRWPVCWGRRVTQTRVVGMMHVYPDAATTVREYACLCEEGRMWRLGREKPRLRRLRRGLAEQGYAGRRSRTAWPTTNMPQRRGICLAPASDRMDRQRNLQGDQGSGLLDATAIPVGIVHTAPHPPLTPPLEDLILYEGVEMPRPVRGDWADGHSAYHAAALEQYRTLTDRDRELAYRAFFALVTQVDRQINRIIGTLREEGMLENTWFIFTSDHGDSMGDHGLWAKSNFFRGSCNIPLIIAPPVKGDLDAHAGEGWQPGTTRSAVVGCRIFCRPVLRCPAARPPVVSCDGKNLAAGCAGPRARGSGGSAGRIRLAGNRFLHAEPTESGKVPCE